MADIFDFYVYDDRSIRFAIAEPIMMEDKDVTQFRFRIPKVLNNIDMTDWEWWFIFVNAKKMKYTTQLTLTDDEDDPDNFSVATYTVGYGFSGYVGSVSFSIEALNVSGENIVNEWHTRTYNTHVIDTLQGTRAVVPEPGGQAGTGLTEAMKQALLQIARKVAYIDEHGQTYYDALYDALYPSASLVSISAVYTQSGTVYDTDTLDSLRSDLVVTAHMSDSTTRTVTDYTLSGTLTAGTSTITVSYGGKTTTFNVTVETAPLYSIPDFAEQTVTKAGRTATIKKENGYYTISGTFDDVAYIYPDGTVKLTKSNTLWFATPADKPIIHEIYDISWNNPTAETQDLACKFSQSNTTGNKATATYTMSANSSGTDGSAEFTNDAYPSANFSAFGMQVYHSGSTRSSDVSVTFKMRLFCDGVRYL